MFTGRLQQPHRVPAVAPALGTGLLAIGPWQTIFWVCAGVAVLMLGTTTRVPETLPPDGGDVKLTLEQADAWLSALNDVRLALGTALDVSEDMPDELAPDDPRAGHLGVYHWLTYVQDGLVQSRMAVR